MLIRREGKNNIKFLINENSSKNLAMLIETVLNFDFFKITRYSVRTEMSNPSKTGIKQGMKNSKQFHFLRLFPENPLPLCVF
ncbi:MAG TPA: hypothetical protein DDZ57_11065 [Porphyromonadaceae bacterium]|nr:hypothetical protein [Porphyromonadaceae bacterium]